MSDATPPRSKAGRPGKHAGDEGVHPLLAHGFVAHLLESFEIALVAELPISIAQAAVARILAHACVVFKWHEAALA